MKSNKKQSMDTIEQRLNALGYSLPPAMKVPAGITLPFSMVRVIGNRALISGHGPQAPDGAPTAITGTIGDNLTVEDGYYAAQLTGLSILGSLKRTLGSLDRIACWGKILGMVAAVPDFEHHPNVINGFSDLIIQLFGEEKGQHSRSAVGMASLPFGIPVEIEGEVMLYPSSAEPHLTSAHAGESSL
ncbi:RidA family protein [Alteromonas gilva]|uniref:RidA family protein n=1 Tax=Alteromonas gilva TaxID=2987522 RepID=A0ABT5L4C2_9ALTE|nr:RidA family protein [Alteromonas gilva]MDC8831903.1 RidA family protein [Alteromonas gilva]